MHMYQAMPRDGSAAIPLLLCRYPVTIHMLYFLRTIKPILSSTSTSQRSTTMDPTAPGTSHTKRYRPYFTPAQVHALSAKQRGKLSISRADRTTQQACGFIDAVGCRLGLSVTLYDGACADSSP